MKNIVRSLFATCIFISLIGCASNHETPASTVETNLNEPEVEEILEPIPVFDDWKYKGFGYEIPEFFEKVFNPECLSEESIPFNNFTFNQPNIEVWCFGENSDQVIHALNSVYEEKLAEFKKANNIEFKNITLTEEYWVKINPEFKNLEQPYLAVRVYKTEE